MFLLYRILTLILFPIFVLIIYLRRFLNKEDKKRYVEKIFVAKSNLPKNKKIFWIHAASIGELNSVVPIIKEIILNNNDIFVLLTSSTLSSSQLIKKEIFDPNRFKHLFFPIDVKFLVNKFLDNWRPDFIIFVDSEVWPNYMLEISKRKIPLMLLNGRITKKTYNRWKKFPSLSKKIFSLYDLCLSASEESNENLKLLGAKNVKFLGNIKFCSIIDKKTDNKNFHLIFKSSNVWCAASTHPGEEEILLNTHIILKKKGLKIVTIIIPRHISKSQEIFSICKTMQLRAQIVNEDRDIQKDKEILIINSIGQMPKYFATCKSIFMGKSLLKKLIKDGGQNPIEPAKFGCKIYHGPYISNFLEIYTFLKKRGVTQLITNELDLANNLFRDFGNGADLSAKIITDLNDHGTKILANTINEIMALKNENI